jgi:hypothetical protein
MCPLSLSGRGMEPFRFAGCTIATYPMQILAHPPFQSKGGFSEFCCVLAALLASTKFLRCRFALWTGPALGCALVFASVAIMQPKLERK